MELHTRNLLFGTGRTHEQLGNTFAPRGWSGAAPEKGSILSTFTGFGRQGAGRERVLGLFERAGMISAEQRAAGGAVEAAAEGVADNLRNLVGAASDAAPLPVATATAGAAQLAPASANPVYDGLYAQMMMREHGYVVPAGPAVADAAPAAAGLADDTTSVIAAAADDIAADVAALEQRWQSSLQRLVQLPTEQQVPTIARAVDATAAAGYGDDALGVLGAALESRPLASATPALEGALADLAHAAAPTVDDAAKAAMPLLDDVAKVAAPLVDDVAKVAVKASSPLLLGGGHALQGVMPFAAGVDDTIRLLARLR